MNKNEVLEEMLFAYENRENDFPVISDGEVLFPVFTKSGIVHNWETKEDLKGYRGLALEINDHGNVTVWNCFKNGNRKEIASRV